MGRGAVRGFDRVGFRVRMWPVWPVWKGVRARGESAMRLRGRDVRESRRGRGYWDTRDDGVPGERCRMKKGRFDGGDERFMRENGGRRTTVEARSSDAEDGNGNTRYPNSALRLGV